MVTLTLKQAGQILGVTSTTIRRWCDTGQLKFMRTLGGHRRVDYEDVKKMHRLSIGTGSGKGKVERVDIISGDAALDFEELLNRTGKDLYFGDVVAPDTPDTPGATVTPDTDPLGLDDL